MIISPKLPTHRQLILATSIALLLHSPLSHAVDYQTYISGTSPVGWWGMNEAGGNNLPTTADLSGAYGAANNGAGTNLNLTYQNTGTNSLTAQTGYVYNAAGANKAAYFDGSSAAGAYGNSPAAYANPTNTNPIYIPQANSGFTAEIWMKTDGLVATDSERFFATREFGFGFTANGSFGALHFTTFAVSDYIGGSMPSDGLWHQIGVSWDGNRTAVFYVDGLPTATVDANAGGGTRAPLAGGANSINLTHRNTDIQHFKGWEDEVVLWNHTRTAADFAASYLAAQTPLVLSIGYWKGSTSSVWNANLNNFTEDLAGTTPATLPVSAATEVIFNAVGASNFSNTTLGADTTIKSLTFGSNATATVGIGGTNTLTITPTSPKTGVTVNSGSATHTISTAVALGASQTWTVTDSTQSLNATGVISGAFSLTKQGEGTLVFTADHTYSGGTIVSVGTLALDYTSAASRLADAGSLTLAGGTVNLQNGASSHNEVVASTIISDGLSTVTRTSGTSILRLNAITSGLGVVNFGASNIADTNRTNTNSILGGWATLGGLDWAKNSTNAANGPITAFTAYTDITAQGSTIADNPLNNVRLLANGLTGNIALGAVTTTVNSLLQSNATIAATIETTGKTLATNAFMVGSTSQGLTIGGAVDDGTLTTATAGGTLFLNNFSANHPLTVNAVIANQTSASTLATVGRVILAGTNTYTGATMVNSGALSLENDLGLGDVIAGTTVHLGAALELSSVSGLTIGAESLTLNGSGIANGGSLRSVSGNNLWQGTVTLATASRINVDTGTLTLQTAINAITGAESLTLGGAGEGTISGKIATTSGGLTKDGSGTWTLSGVNSYPGSTTLSGGTLGISAAANLGASSANLVFDGGTLRVGGSLNSLTALAHSVSFNPTKTVGLNIAVTNFTADKILNQTTGGLTKLGAGILTLNQANTYTGTTTIAEGTLKASSIVVTSGASNLGNATSAVILGSPSPVIGAFPNPGTLTYTGSTATYTRGFDIQGSGSGINAFTAGQTLTIASSPITSATDSTLILGGAGNLTFTAPILLGATSGSLIKDGSGILNLNSPTQTKTLTTYFAAGTTNINAPLTAIGGTDVLASANLKFGSVSQSLASLSIDPGVTVTFSSGLASGAFTSSGKSLALVPEPSALALLLLGSLATLRRRRHIS